MIIFGIDPGPTLAESHCSLLSDGEFYGSGNYYTVTGDNVRFQPFYGHQSHSIKAQYISAAIIETVDTSGGVYMRKGEVCPSRARSGKVMQTYASGMMIADALYRAGVAVYCVPRREILRQAGIATKGADAIILHYLWQHEYIGALDKRKRKDGTPYFVSLTLGLTTTHSRDALMAALFAYSDPRNEQYKYGGAK